MLYVPVVSSTGKPLMPCHPARARELVRSGRAVRRFDRGLFYIRLTDRADGEVQAVTVGIDPGSKQEGFTVKSEAHTYLNIQADAVDWVSDHVKTRRDMRRLRRYRNTPCRKNRANRSVGGLPPSTKARWQWKLRISRWLARVYPIESFVVEDICARTKGNRRWDKSFSPLQVGKQWMYSELGKLGRVVLKQGWETKEMRVALGLKKTSNKMADAFEAHCVDSWVLAPGWAGGHVKPGRGGIRGPYGGTRSHGFKRGSLVKHPIYGVTYVGGCLKDRISLHRITDGARLCQNARPSDCEFLAFNSWRMRLLPCLKTGVSAA